ncbi:tRNA 2-selenouridine(34) synthase MnmH [Pseudalkalibacillus caeni]|uniref:tRNA 2-selenouridine(34) synthase MnmH n=1 Tax=Exobacillus caeni TaxID=2574798 RepID=A0A5R9EXI4_9BACL|nr:tRNA 2-selenouridine(34) synthase MnmH [Pseudalkalibacillus caeni]TLS35982.1 tRNA 2-selenouridine(34) synthase MnmH [Pseudalkalibacillus caeni]
MDIQSIKVAKVENISTHDFHIIDVRSPKEYEEFHLPEAVNVPIFSNEERARVGTMYKQIGQDDAKQLGIELVSPKLSGFYQKLRELQEQEQKPVLIYCARGGMRSKSIASVMTMMGLDCKQLEGGIRAYRQHVVVELERFKQQDKPFIVLEGHTGTRKTEFLERLQLEGYPVIDLEGMAGHRGSLFGHVGLKQRSQKEFESLLYQRLEELKDAEYYIIESESKKIGNLFVPKWILKGKEEGTRIRMHDALTSRVDFICQIYKPEEHAEELRGGLQRVLKQLPDDVRADVIENFEKDDYWKVIKDLLVHYYDPRYDHAAQRYHSEVIDIQMDQEDDVLLVIKKTIDDIVSKQAVFSNVKERQ